MTPRPAGIGQQSVADHPEMLEIHIGGLDRRIGAVREWTVDAIASVAARPPTEAATVYLEINPIPTISQMRDCQRMRCVVPAGNDVVGNDLGQRFQHGVEAPIGRE